jgi:hypothetical protein
MCNAHTRVRSPVRRHSSRPSTSCVEKSAARAEFSVAMCPARGRHARVSFPGGPLRSHRSRSRPSAVVEPNSWRARCFTRTHRGNALGGMRVWRNRYCAAIRSQVLLRPQQAGEPEFDRIGNRAQSFCPPQRSREFRHVQSVSSPTDTCPATSRFIKTGRPQRRSA